MGFRISRNGHQCQVETSMTVFLHLSYFVFMLVVVTPPAGAWERVNDSEWSSLLKLRDSLGIKGSDWPIKAKPCWGWKGVVCEQGKVVEINISGFRRTRLGRANPSFSVDSLVNLTSLHSFNASGFLLHGAIPDWFGSRLSSLHILDLRSCSLTGSVPPSLGNLMELQALYLSDNALYGTLPETFGQLINLEILDLSVNSITEKIPDTLSSLTKLSRLDLSSNSLSGLIPPALGSFSKLQHLNLSDNQLSGSIPSTFGNLSSLVELDLSKNLLSGTLPEEFKRLITIRRTGSLLNLSNISFSGFDYFDLSENYLEGIFDGYQSNTVLTFNCLQEKLQQRSLSECTLFYEKKGLKFDNFGLHQPQEQEKKSEKWIFILAGVIGCIGFIGICVLLIVRYKIFAKKKGCSGVGPVPDGDNQASPKDMEIIPGLGHPFTYEQLASLTRDFHESSIIKHGHTGDIFQASVGGNSVVVKRLNSRVVKKESFVMELELLSKHSHFRLVPLLGHCMDNENGKFFIYKYMENRDLANSLHRKVNKEQDGLGSLDWITRLKIAIGAAEGLSHLHHGCNPPLVHRDVQASSILLDDKFEVRLGSLSGVCVQEGEGREGMFSRFLRKSQSSDAGITGVSSATCTHDVYCFGKVLLELVTGKLGISSSDDGSTREWLEQTMGNIDIYDKELLSKIVDPSLILDEDLSDEVWAMSIVAKSCLNPKPGKRPLMRHVLRALENPWKIVRGECCSSRRLKTTSSRTSWSAAVFGSKRNSSSENNINGGQNSREGTNSFKLSSRVASYESGKMVLPSFKGTSNEILPFSGPLDICSPATVDV